MTLFAERERLYAIGHVAKILGVTPQALRAAEVEGRVPPPRREPLYDSRLYSDADIELLRKVFSRER
jgi:DNA-binding transcriptional MerR regulator